MRILHVAAEVHPLIKTGGLADVVGSLPAAQAALGHDVAVLMPGYPAVKAAGPLQFLFDLNHPGEPPAQMLRGELAGGVELLVLDQPYYFERPGTPYTDERGHGWRDNYRRFAHLGYVGARYSQLDDRGGVLHAHDWHAGLAPAYLRAALSDRASCFTIHNIAYQGRYGVTEYAEVGLPGEFYRFDGLEFHGDWSFLKAGLAYSDAITTVSPTYAREILTPEFGFGLDGLLNYRRGDLHGILNGVDYTVWNPASDAALTQTYDAKTLKRKAANKAALQAAVGLESIPDRMLVGMVSRLTVQKGFDLALEPLAALLADDALQLVLLGSGAGALEAAFAELAHRFPGRCAVQIGYDELQAHRIFGGADATLVPSRFEPCGLTQMYGLRYGTLPIVRKTGGLADTVTDYTGKNRDSATGFVFGTASPVALRRTLGRALKAYSEPALWRRLAQNGMRQDFGWDRAARAYIDLYARIGAK